MKIPKKIKIGYLTYQITTEEAKDLDNQIFGSHDDRTQTIYINPKYSDEQQEATLLHEIIHAAIVMSGLSVRFDYKNAEHRPTHEEVATEITPFLLEALKQLKF